MPPRAALSQARGIAGAVLLIGSSLPAAAARADDWPSRGLDPASQHVSAERSGALFNAGAWTAAIPGNLWSTSSPVVADGIVVFGTRDGSVRALAASTGRPLWQVKTGGQVVASPAIHSGRVFVPSLDDQLRALRLADGALLWTKDLGGLIQSSAAVIDGAAGVGDSIIVAGGYPIRKVFRIDAATGQTLWETPPDAMIQFSNSVAVTDGEQVVVGAMGGQLTSFDLATGARRWTYVGDGMINLSAPTIVAGRVYLLPGGDSGRVHAVDLATGGATPGWPVDLPPPPEDARVRGTRLDRSFAVSSLTPVSDRLLFDVRIDDSIDTDADGVADQILMREFAMALSTADGHVVWQRANGRRVVASANDSPKGWLCPTPAAYQGATSSSSPLIAVASTLLPAVTTLDATTGALRGTIAVAAPSRVSPVIANGRLLLATETGTIQGNLSSTNQPPDAPTLLGDPGRPVGAAFPTFRWAPALDPDGDAVTYQLRLDHDGEVLESWEAEITTGPGETSAHLARTLQPGLTYVVAVRARDAKGAWSDWSQPQFLAAVETPLVSVGGGAPQADLGAALAGAAVGQVVRLGAGTFHLTDTVRVPAGVALEGAGPSRTILDAGGQGQATAVSIAGSIDGKPAEVRSLTVTGAAIGIAVGAAHDARIRNVIVRDNREAGIDVGAAGTASLTNATLVANQRAVRSFGTITVKNSLVAGNQIGFVSEHADAIASRFNDLTGNGIALQGMTAGADDLARDVAFASYARRDLHVMPAQPSTDRGDPADDFSAEPAPNGGRINLGAFGGTSEAETSAPAPAPLTDGPGGEGRPGGGCSAAGAVAPAPADARSVAMKLALFGLAILLLRLRRRRLAAILLALFTCLGPSRASSAVVCEFLGTGGSGGINWSTSGAWSKTGSGGSCPPGASDTALYDTGSRAQIVDANINVASITITSGFTGSITLNSGITTTVSGSFSQDGATFTGNTGAITIGGDFILSHGTFVSSTGTLNVGGAFNATGGTFTHNSGTVLLGSTSSKTFASNGIAFNKLIINDGLVGYWKLDETSLGTAADSSGFGNDGTHTGSPTLSTTVPSVSFNDPRSVSLNGTSQCVTLPNATNMNIAGPITIAAWVNTTSASTFNDIVEHGYTQGPNAGVYLRESSGNYECGVFPSSGSDVKASFAIPSGDVGSGTWVHLACTYDGTAWNLYRNGVPVAKTTSATGPVTVTLNWSIGGRAACDGRWFNGLIDDVRLYKRALSATEVSGLAGGNQAGTVSATQTLTGAPTIASDLVIASGGLAAGANNLTVGGSWWNTGGVYSATSGSVTFNGSAATNKILSGGSPFGSVIINGSGTWTLADRMEIDPAAGLTTTAGTFSLSSYTLRAGDINRNGAVTITPSTGTVVIDPSASQTLDAGTFNNLRVEPVAATNLVGYWKLDRAQGSTASDFSGGGNPLTLNNGPTWITSGLPGALSFDNPAALTLDGSKSQYLATASFPAALQPTSMTLSAWYKATSVDTSGSEIISGSNRYTLRVVSNTQVWVIKETGSSAWVSLIGTVSNALDGNWHHLAGVITPSGMAVYFDGASLATNSDTTAIYYTSPTVLDIGRNDTNTAYDFTGSIDDIRIYNTALTAAQIASLAAGTNPAGLAGTPTITLGNNTTVSGTLSLDNGTLATSSYTMNASSASSAATLSSGTYSVGSTTSTFAGGLTVNEDGTLSLASSGGTVAIGSAKTLTMNGTLSASSTGATIKTAGGAGTFYAFTVGSAASATPVLNITGLAVKNTDTNGMNINSVHNSVTSTTTFTRFDNIAFSSGTGTQLLQIYAPSLYLVSNGCTFDSGSASGSTTYNVTLIGDGTASGASETRALFGNSTAAGAGASTCATNRTPCESYDNDDDTNTDGLGDTVASNGAVIQWVHSAMADTSGTIEGFPAAAFDWNTFTYYSTYVMFHDVNGGTADRIYVRDTNGNFNYPSYYWDSPSGVDLVGTPRFDTVSSVHYVYVATTTGKVYRLVDDTSAHTLTQDNSGSWAGANNPFDCSCTISTPLTIDASNIYWGGTASGNNQVWTLGKSNRTLATSSPVTVTAVVSGAAPTAWTSGHTYVFMGSLAHFYKVDVNTQTLTTDNAPTSAANVNGRISLINSKVYGADSKGYLWVLDPTNFATTLWSYHDNTNHSGCAANSVCAITGSLYVDPLLNRAFYGDGDGHLYASYNSSGSTGAQLTNFPFVPGSSADVFGSAPLYNSGILVAGTTTGNVYVIDINGGSGPVLKQTYKLGTANKVSGVGYDKGSASYMIATANATNKDGKLIYIDAMADPTPGSN